MLFACLSPVWDSMAGQYGRGWGPSAHILNIKAKQFLNSTTRGWSQIRISCRFLGNGSEMKCLLQMVTQQKMGGLIRGFPCQYQSNFSFGLKSIDITKIFYTLQTCYVSWCHIICKSFGQPPLHRPMRFRKRQGREKGGGRGGGGGCRLMQQVINHMWPNHMSTNSPDHQSLLSRPLFAPTQTWACAWTDGKLKNIRGRYLVCQQTWSWQEDLWVPHCFIHHSHITTYSSKSHFSSPRTSLSSLEYTILPKFIKSTRQRRRRW